MGKENYSGSQLELFYLGKQTPQLRNEPPPSFFKYIRQYEKTLIIFIAFIISSIVSFSLGVEKGKRTAMLKLDSQLDTAALQTHPIDDTLTKQKLPVPFEPLESPKVKNPPPLYTIQLASYRAKSIAEAEARRLRKNGFSPLLLSKGSYTVLCVGNFSDKKNAASLLAQFKKRYGDCLLRRL